MNLIIDLLAIFYFIYKYFIQLTYLSQTGNKLTNYQFWGLREWKIIYHYVKAPLVVIFLTLIASIIFIQLSKDDRLRRAK